MCSFQAFQTRLKEQYGLHEVVEATWVKTKQNGSAHSLLLTFYGELPQYINVPGEMTRTKVYEHKQRPFMCRNCLEYGHGKNSCQNEKRCSKENHEKSECKSDGARCYHCGQDHEVGDGTCVEHKYQEEIIAVQAKERVPRAQAKIIFDKRHPQFWTMNYAAAKLKSSVCVDIGQASSSTTKKVEPRKKQQQPADEGSHV